MTKMTEMTAGELVSQLALGLEETIVLFLFCLLFGMAAASVRFRKTMFLARLFDALSALFVRIPPCVGVLASPPIGLLFLTSREMGAWMFLFLCFLLRISDGILGYLQGREENLIQGLAENFCELWRTFYLYLAIYKQVAQDYLYSGSPKEILTKAALTLFIYWGIGMIAGKALPRLFQRETA